MSPPNIAELFQKAQQLKGRLEAVQAELAVRRFEGAAGGGMVKAVATGELRIVALEIEPSLAESGDLAMLQDLCAAAVNAALANAQQGVQAEMQKVSGGLGIPGLGNLGPS